MSQEYVGAIVILIVSVLKVFKVEVENSAIEGIIIGAIALWVAVRRVKKGDITPLGFRR